MNTLTIAHPTGKYHVYVGYDLLTQLKELLPLRGSVALVTDDRVGPLYGKATAAQLDRPTTIITVPTGEQHKNLTTVRQIYDEMFAAGCDRKSTVLALGGGVINDMVGFAAASFMRGVDFATCPTTLLSMVDASVGGKTGVDMPQGKNLVGAFKQPTAVLADLSTLKTLPRDEFAAGMAEVIKHGLLSDPVLFRQTQEMDWYAEMMAQNQALLDMVTAAIRVKQEVVQEDPFEGGRRALLNLGHTFGHAIEQVSHYRVK
ncbi:MAG: 3-dehydroquinate synthase, partial [Anaerolineales bacterium]|nr:3-dehydroquinate synthase [Anaerolineales bacterium]